MTSIGEWKVSVAHREDLSMSLSQTFEFKQRLDSEVLERQRLERYVHMVGSVQRTGSDMPNPTAGPL